MSGPAAPVVVYTDGACSGNPGPGGWAWAEPDGRWASGADGATTNQRMEITAAYEAVRAHDGPVHVVSDSTYVVNCFNDRWWQGWIAKGWRNSKKEPVANRDLWEPFVALVQERAAAGAPVTFAWVKGHGGDPMNDLVDRLAVRAAQSQTGASGDGPPSADQLAEPDRPRRRTAPTSAPSSGGSDGGSAGGSEGRSEGAADEAGDPAAARRAKDRRIPEGWTVAVVGVRAADLAEQPAGVRAAAQLTEILGAQRQLHPDLVVLTGLRPGAEQLGAAAARAAGVPYVVVLPYPDPAATLTGRDRQVFDEGCAAAASVLVLERSRPADAEGRRAAMARRDGWLRGAACGAVVVSDGADPEAERLVRRFEEVLGEEVWFLDLA